MANRRLFLYSPTKPLKTGTANYFDLFLKQLGFVEMKNLEITIVVDKRIFKGGENVYGNTYKVEDFRRVDRDQKDISLYFLANNEYHRYIHRALYGHKAGDGLAISIVHEPDMWMNVEAMCNLGEYGFNKKDLSYFASYEFGKDASFFCHLFERRQTDQNFQYSSLAGTHIYEHSDIVVFHSYFARAKFLLEKATSYIAKKNGQQFLVMSHPPENIVVKTTNTEPRGKFIVGTYGWVKKVKQVEPIIEAFNDFYQDLDLSDKKRVQLDVAGEIDIEESDFDPIGLVATLPSAGQIYFYGYLSDEKLNTLMSQASVALSLRFPSCGETSGPLFKARALGLTTVLSDYASFAEEPADYHISVKKQEQHDQLVKVLKREYAIFKTGKPRATRYATNRSIPKLNVDELLDKALTFSDNGSNCL